MRVLPLNRRKTNVITDKTIHADIMIIVKALFRLNVILLSPNNMNYKMLAVNWMCLKIRNSDNLYYINLNMNAQ